jgi:hypothetical protein
MDEKDKVGREALNSASDKTTEPPADAASIPPHSPVERNAADGSVMFFAYLILLFIVYGFLSFTLPGLLSELADNPVGTLGILIFGFVIFVGVIKINGSLSRSSFVEIDRKARGESVSTTHGVNRYSLSTIIKNIYARSSPLDSRVIEEIAAFSVNQKKIDGDKFVGRQRPLGTAFELYVCSVVESLDKHISLTEEKGSNLLDRGLLFLFGGIFYYVAAIAAWQVWAKYGEPKDSVMYIGMFASSVVFLVCEFLAAWFLKQYRHYVDASLACLRVKSVYDRYLLSYYAVKDVGPDTDGVSEKLNRVLETIKEDVMWPEHKENLANDFNYMLESMSSVHASLDKLKGVFESKAEPGKGKKKIL